MSHNLEEVVPFLSGVDPGLNIGQYLEQLEGSRLRERIWEAAEEKHLMQSVEWCYRSLVCI